MDTIVVIIPAVCLLQKLKLPFEHLCIICTKACTFLLYDEKKKLNFYLFIFICLFIVSGLMSVMSFIVCSNYGNNFPVP